jgi:N-acyl homoserine lactone hydrolase
MNAENLPEDGLTITAIRVGVVRNFPQPALTYLRGFNETRDLAMIMFVITGGDHPIIVDTGTADPESVLTHHNYILERPDEEEPLRALLDAGVNPEDVKTVILTHLHWDHCSNNHLFPNAEFIVQQDELHYAVDPAEPQRVTYERTKIATPPWLPQLGRFVTVKGEESIAPGVSVVPLPGHSPGSQGILVETNGGRYLIAGDCIDSYHNWEGDAALSHIPSGGLTDLVAYMESFKRIEQLDCEVIPSHDQAVVERRVFK